MDETVSIAPPPRLLFYRSRLAASALPLIPRVISIQQYEDKPTEKFTIPFVDEWFHKIALRRYTQRHAFWFNIPIEELSAKRVINFLLKSVVKARADRSMRRGGNPKPPIGAALRAHVSQVLAITLGCQNL
ncbi:hypothetical protein [Paraburkholderia sp. HP33-1]|uniref:hypothetical protein n=1 Tax=Paraburkholderia sp. HP33-1 TaxID=2883243 RepID=UPI001F399618|nr:hypothetical protein [Paraburkholderia sp. HP33-1]